MGEGFPVSIFISYSSADDAAVRSLVSDLEYARQTVWLDQDLTGGDAWWAKILEQIRSADVFVFALSDKSLQSKPCQSEMAYARALGIPILPIQIADVESYRVDPIFSMQMVDYRKQTLRTGVGLVLALQDRASQRRPLPEQLPDPPPIPYEYLQRLGQAIEGEAAIAPNDQAGILIQLRQGLRDEDDETVLKDIRKLLRQLRRRPEVTYTTVTEIDALLSPDETSPGQVTGPSIKVPGTKVVEKEPEVPPQTTPAHITKAPGWYPDPTGNPRVLRYWNGTTWTQHVTERTGPAPTAGY
jgi:hypothetical protein